MPCGMCVHSSTPCLVFLCTPRHRALCHKARSTTPQVEECTKIRSAVARANARAVSTVPTSSERRHGDVATATSSSSARASTGRGALPRPTAR
eukprot:5914657-Prymnesium_polylepis.1